MHGAEQIHCRCEAPDLGKGTYHTMSDINKKYDEEELMITLEMEDGTEEDCIVLAIFPMGENEQQYIALMPADADADAEDAEVYLYRYSEDEDGQPILGDIDDDAEFEAVCDRFDEIADEEEYTALAPEE